MRSLYSHFSFSPLSSLNEQSGVVLIVVMWIVMFLSTIGGSLILVTTAERGTHATHLDQEQGEYLAHAAIADLGFQALEYYSLPADQRAPEFTDELVKQDVLGREMPMGQGSVRLELADEWGKINLNAAKPEVLQALLAALGIPNSAGLAQAIVAWRTEARPFLRVAEVGMIPEMTPDYVARLLPYLTVYTDDVSVNPNSASEPVLAAVCQALREQFETESSQRSGESPPPPDPGALINGRPWTGKKLSDELKKWASSFKVNSQIFQVNATGMVRGRSCTVVMVGQIMRMTTGESPAAAWRIPGMLPKKGRLS